MNDVKLPTNHFTSRRTYLSRGLHWQPARQILVFVSSSVRHINMGEPYLSLISGFIGAVIGALASLTVVWIQGRHWLRQQAWSNREHYYMDLLAYLSKLKSSLEDRSEYYAQPGSEHDTTITEGVHFRELSNAGAEAIRRLREQVGPASVFLSAGAVQALETLIHEHWNVAEDAICTADYVGSALKVVNTAYLAVLTEAKEELANTRDA